MEQSGFKFSDPIITQINYIIHPNYKLEGKNTRITNSFETQIQRDANNSRAIVELSIKVGDQKPEKAPFFIQLSIQAIFKWDNVYTEDTVQSLLSVNAPALLLGYARPLISTITGMSPYPTYNIPFYNFTK